jgi:serine/threonine protein kinase
MDESLGRDVALKELLFGREVDHDGTPIEVQRSKEMASRFIREAKITGQLEHPSITQVHELGRRSDGSLYYTMKLVRGRTLAKAMDECEALSDRLKMLPHIVDLCNAVAYAHSRHVIHRDIKPANVMIGDYGETVIVDWGLAKVLEAQEEESAPEVDPDAATVMGVRDDTPGAGHETRAGELLGTPVYMSPEQARGLVANERSDIYSLGAVLYELLTGRAPFTGNSVNEIITQVIHDEPASPRSMNRKIQEDLSLVCMKAMAKKAGDRFDSAKEFADELDALKIRKDRGLVMKAAIWTVKVSVAAVLVFLLIVSPILNFVTGRILAGKYEQLEEENIPVYYDDVKAFFLNGVDVGDGDASESFVAEKDSVGSLLTLYEQYPSITDMNGLFYKTQDEFTEKFSSEAPLTRSELERLRRFLTANRELIGELKRIGLSDSVSPQMVDYMLAGVDSPISVPIPNLMTMRTTTNLLCLEARLSMLDGDYEGAVEELISTFRFLDRMDVSNSLITVMIKVAMYDVAFDVYLEIPMDRLIDNDALERLEAQVLRHQPYRDLEVSFEGEFNMQLAVLNELKSGNVAQFSLSNPFDTSGMGGFSGVMRYVLWPLQFYVNNQESYIIDLNRDLLLECRKPYLDARAGLDAFDARVDDLNAFFHPIASIMLPNLSRVAMSAIEGDQKRNLILLSLDARRYYAEHGQPPAHIQDFVGDDREVERRCLLSGADVRYALENDALLIYSYGHGGDDDGGVDFRENRERDEAGIMQGDVALRVPLTNSNAQTRN